MDQRQIGQVNLRLQTQVLFFHKNSMSAAPHHTHRLSPLRQEQFVLKLAQWFFAKAMQWPKETWQRWFCLRKEVSSVSGSRLRKETVAACARPAASGGLQSPRWIQPTLASRPNVASRRSACGIKRISKIELADTARIRTVSETSATCKYEKRYTTDMR